MKCPRCQHENRSGAKFCEECASPLARTCSNCGTALSVTAKFCHACAHPVAAGGSTPPRSPDSYTPKHLAEKILTSKSVLEGERKQVTVLFADLKGSMELLADRDPEEARKLLDPVLEHMMEAVHRFEGTVNQVMGDGIMALFGAPVAHEDHAVRACYAALRMQESVAQYAEGMFRSHGVPMQIRVGLNSGDVVVRAIGSDLHMDYTAVGQTTHLAARMEQMATPGTTLVAPATLQLAEGYVQVTARGPVVVKGLPEPVEIYVLTGASAQRSRLHVAAARGLTRFVGRDAEIEQIRRAHTLAQEGRGQLVAIVGEPGVGKSRLMYEFTHSLRTQDWLMLEASSASYGKATSYLPVIDVLKAYFKVSDRETHREIREKVTGKLLTLDRALEPVLPALLALLDVPVEDEPWASLDPLQRRQRTFDAVKRLLLRASQVQPLILVFEDLHWIDSETQTVLDSLVESLPTAQVLLLVNYRPEYQHAWGSKTYYRQLRIDPLPPESADELLDALLGADVALRPLKRLLVERTEANPLFLEESVRTLVEMAALAGERGDYRLIQPVQQVNIPATVQAILAARIDRLAPEAKRVLQTAAVIGKDVPMPLLQAIADAPENDVRATLTRLQAAEFLYEIRLFPDLEYTFKHALTHEVAYGSLLQERRRTLHARTVAAIERLYADSLVEQVERLAHHALRGEVWAKAVSYLRQAGAKAEGRAARREAVGYLEQALAALEHLPDALDTQMQGVDIRLDLRGVLTPLAENRRLLDHLREAQAVADALGDQRRQGQVAASLTRCLYGLGDHVQAVEAGQRAIAIARALGDVPLGVTTRLRLGEALNALGRYQEARELLIENVLALQGDLLLARFGAIIVSVGSLAALVWCLAELGEFAEGSERGAAAIRIAETAGHPFSLGQAYHRLGYLHVRQGNLDQATALLQRGDRIGRDGQTPALFLRLAPDLGYAYLLAGRLVEGLAILEAAVTEEASAQQKHQHSLLLTRLGEGYLVAGRTTEADDHARRALTLARQHGEQGHAAWALRLLGEIAALGEPLVEQAEGYYRQALALAEPRGMRPLVAHCHLGLGKLYQRTGKREQAQEHLAIATTMYGEMGMTYWLEKAETKVRERS